VNPTWFQFGSSNPGYIINGPLAAGDSTVVSVKFSVSDSFTGTSLTNVAEISNADDDTDSSNTPPTDLDSTPDANPGDPTTDDVVDNSNGDEDDNDLASITVNQVFDLALTKVLVGNATYAAGDTATFRIYIHNQGTIAATSVTVKDILPADLILADTDWAGDSTYTFSAGLAVGAIDSVDVDVQINPAFMGTSITNNAEISVAANALNQADSDSTPNSEDGNSAADGVDNDLVATDGSDDFDPAVVTVGQVFDLALIEDLAPGQSGTIAPGDTGNIKITVTNQGTVTADEITITQSLPAGVTINDIDIDAFVFVDDSEATITLTPGFGLPIGGLLPDSMLMINLEVLFDENIRANNLTLYAEISDDGAGDDIDSTPNNDLTDDAGGVPNSATDNVMDNSNGDEDDHDPVFFNVQLFDLALKKVFADGQATTVRPGDTVAYNIWVFNQGNTDAFDINVNDYAGLGLVYDANINTGWSLVNGNLRRNFFGPLAAGDSVVMNINFIIDTEFTGNQIVNSAEIASADDDGSGSNDGPTDLDSNPDDNPNNDPYGGNNIINNTGNDEDDADDELLTVVLEEFDLALTITPAPGQATAINAGDEVETKVTIFNQGDVAADTIQILANLPAGVSLSATNPSGWYQINDSTIVIELGTADLPGGAIADGDMHMIPLFLDIANDVMVNSLTIRAEINFDGVGNDDIDSTTDSNPNNDILGGDNITNNTSSDEDDHDPVTFTLMQNFDLALTKRLATGQLSGVSPGDTIHYTITVLNQGSLDAYDVDVVDYIPAGMSLVPSTGWTSVSADMATTTVNFVSAGSSVPVNIAMVIDNNFAGTNLTNTAEITEAATSAGGTPITADDDSPFDNNPANNGTPTNNEVDGANGDQDNNDFETIEVGSFDLSLNKTLAAGQALGVRPGEVVSYTITVKNEGIFPGYDVEVVDHLPQGMILSGSDTNGWIVTGSQLATNTIPGPIQPGDSVSINIDLLLTYGNPNSSIKNVAEVAGATDSEGNFIKDVDSEPETTTTVDEEEFFEDDEAAQAITLEDYDPIGYIYCDKTGVIITGGRIEVTSMPIGGSIFYATDGITGDTLDGRTGYYQFFTNGVPGIYEMTYIHPNGFPLSTTILREPGAFDPTGRDGDPAFDRDGDANNNYVTLGSDVDSNYLADITIGANPYYMSFDLEAGDPFIDLNNIPVSCIFIGTVVCEDNGGDGNLDTGVDNGFAGLTVNLYDCTDTLTPIATTLTEANGGYRFDGLDDGCYKVQFAIPNNYYIPTDNGIIGFNGWSEDINLTYGQCDTTTTTCFTPCPTPVTVPEVANICQGETVQLSTTVNIANATYTWSPAYALSDPFIANPIANPALSTTYIVEINPGGGACVSYDTVRINVFDVPNPDFHANVACVGQPTIFDDETTTYTTLTGWSWDFGDGVGTSTEQNPAYTYTAAGHYLVKLIVESTNGCRDSSLQEITVNPGAQAGAKGRQDTICVGECVELLAQGGTTFSWSPAATLNHTDCFNPIACPTETTTYYVDVTNDFGCTSRDSVTITVVPGPTVAVEMTDISECGTFDGTITVNATGLANYEYSINGGLTYQSSPTFTGLPASSYLVVVKGGSCEVPYANNPVIVGGAASPAITAVPTVNPSCTADDGTITIEASGATNLVYSINGGINWVTENEFTDLAGGIYYVAVASADRSCITYYPPVTLTKPEAPVFTDVRLTNPSDCGVNDGTVTIIATGDNAIEYGLDNGLMTVWQSSNNFINLPAGIYDVYIRNAGNTCVTPYALNSIELADPAAPALTSVAIMQPTDCGTDNATINIVATAGSAALEYSIDGGINWNNFAYYENLKPGTYNVFVRNQGGTCEVAYSNNPIDISYPDGATIVEVLHDQPQDCTTPDGRIEITAEGGAADLVYSIDAGTTWQESSIFENLTGGIYNIRVANADLSCPAIYPTIELFDAIGGTIDRVTVDGGCEDGSGTISIATTSDTPLEYSVDGGATYQPSNNFINLPNGSYSVVVRNVNDQCAVVYDGNPISIDRNFSGIDNVQGADPITCGSEDGSISVNATGNNIVYSIDGGINFQNTGNFDNLPAGIYNIFIKDLDTGCEEAYVFNPLELVGPEQPTISNVAVTSPADCDANNGVITIVADGNGGLEYSLDGSTWSNNNTFINMLPGLYNVWVRNNDESCAVAYANNPVVITAPSGPSIVDCVGSNPTDCDVNDGTLTVIANGGVGNLRYSIDGGTTWQTSNEFTGLAAGVYSVAVANEDETCRAIHPLCELVAPQPPVVNDVLAVSPNDCGEDNGSITILADGNGGLEYSIDNGRNFSGNSFFGNLAAGTYDIIVRNAADNCNVDYGPVTLDAPAAPTVVAGMADVSTCTGSSLPVSITISENIEQYTILGSGGYLNAIVAGSTLTFDAFLNGVVNNFTVTLENADGCSVVEEFAIFQAGDPEADFIVHNPTCAATDVTVEFTGDASPGAVLTWDLAGATIVSTSPATATAPAGATLIVQWPTPGGKTIRLDINDGGCEDRSVQNINVNKLPFADAGTDVTICDGECVQLNGIGNGSQYVWSPAIGLSATDIPNPMACPPVTTTYQLLVMGADGCMVMDEITVTVAGELTASAGPDENICEGDAVQLNATGGIAYEWSPSTGLSNPNIANPIATPQTITTYTVKVTSASGCIGTDEMVVTVTPKPTVEAGMNQMICVGENTMLSATGAISYVWSPATGLNATNTPNPIASPAVTTTYTVVGTDANGCTDTDEVIVIVGGNAQANAGADVSICAGADAPLNASGGVTYSWNPTIGLSNPNIANPTASPSATTTYTVTVTNLEGCIGTDEVTVNVNGFIVANAGADQTICNGSTAFLNATGGVSYVWSPATGLNNPNIANPVASPATTTVYTVTSTNAEGCTATDQVTVNINGTCDSDGDGLSDAEEDKNSNGIVDAGESDPNDPCDPFGATANAGADQTICGGSAVFLSATGGVSYAWSPATGLNNPNIANPTATVNTTTTYTVTVTDARGCTDTDQVTINVNGNINVGISPDVTICGDQPAFLNATGGTTYSWSPAAGLNNPNVANPIANPTQTTTYCVTTANAQGCTGTACVTVTVAPGPTVVGCPDKYICDGGSVRLTVNGGVSWTWSPATGLDNPNSPAPNASPSQTTTYIVTGTDANGCSASDEVIVFVNEGINANAGTDQTVCSGTTAQLNATGGVTYNWSPTFGLSNPNIANPTLIPIATTTYTVAVTNAEGCTGTDQVTVFVDNNINVNAGNDATVCSGSSTQLNATGGSNYVWSPATGLSNANIANPVASPTVTTTYTVTTLGVGNCSGSDQVTVFVTQPTEVVGCEDKTICPGGSTPLNVTTGVSYLYTPATGLSDPTSPTPVASPPVTTTYTVYVTDANGCTGSDQITVFVSNNASVSAGPDQTICSGTAAGLNATGGANYVWSPATGLSSTTVANPSAAPAVTTTYTVTSTTGTGCTATDQVTVFVTDGATVSAGVDQSMCAGENVQLTATGGATYSWSPATGLSNANIANPTASPAVTTTYTVTTTNGSCSSTDQVTVAVLTAPTVTPVVTNSGCCNNDGRIYLPVIGGSGNFIYNWTPNVSTSNTASNLVAGDYKVVVTDQMGCDIVVDITLGQDCDACIAIAPEREVCVDQNATNGEICLPVNLTDIGNYQITTPGSVIVPNHGCNFENLTAYSYSLLQGAGNDGPYKIDNWTVNGIVYTGMVDNMTELTSWMNTIDPTGNWTLNSPVLIIMGGNPIATYGDMQITHQVSWIETTLNPNTTGVATGTLVEVPMNGANELLVTITDIRTCCEETVLLKRCFDSTPPVPTCTEEIVTDQAMTVTTTCGTTGKVCIDVPLESILNYDITADGVPYAGGFSGCNFDTLFAYTYFTMPDRGANGPYQLRSWTVDGFTFSGPFNTLADLITLMNSWDPNGNWRQDENTLTIQGGMSSRKYGTMDIEQVNTGAFAILELNSNLLPLGTELAFNNGTHQVVMTNKTTGCIDQFSVTVNCNEPKVECEDFIARTAESLNVGTCDELATFCVEIPSADLGIYSIDLNGSIYTGAIDKCDTDGGTIQLYAGEGKNIFTFTNELTECTDQIVIKVNCLQTGGAKTPTSTSIALDNQVTPTIGGSRVPMTGTTVTTPMNESSRISVIEDKQQLESNPNVIILEQPQHGSLAINADNTVTYQPEEGYCDNKRVDFFRYEICTDEGCEESRVDIIVECTPIKVYSGFSPNRDDINDYFKIDGLENYPENELKVYNRVGKLLFQEQGYNNDWGGEVDGEILPNGTYFYILSDGKGNQYSGFLQISQ